MDLLATLTVYAFKPQASAKAVFQFYLRLLVGKQKVELDCTNTVSALELLLNGIEIKSVAASLRACINQVDLHSAV